MMKRALIAVAVIVVLALSLLTVMTITTAVAVKEASVGEEGSSLGVVMTKFNFGDTHMIVSTGSAEDVFEVHATSLAFERLDALGVFKQRPRLVMVEFDDTSLIQFPPENIQ